VPIRFIGCCKSHGVRAFLAHARPVRVGDCDALIRLLGGGASMVHWRRCIDGQLPAARIVAAVEPSSQLRHGLRPGQQAKHAPAVGMWLTHRQLAWRGSSKFRGRTIPTPNSLRQLDGGRGWARVGILLSTLHGKIESCENFHTSSDPGADQPGTRIVTPISKAGTVARHSAVRCAMFNGSCDI
jgi:hypothetical protein